MRLLPPSVTLIMSLASCSGPRRDSVAGLGRALLRGLEGPLSCWIRDSDDVIPQWGAHDSRRVDNAVVSDKYRVRATT